MSLTDLQIAEPQDMVSLSKSFENATSKMVMTPAEINPNISHSANFNHAVSANLNHEPQAPEGTADPSRSINTGPQTVPEQVERCSADMKATSPVMELFGGGMDIVAEGVGYAKSFTQPNPEIGANSPDAPAPIPEPTAKIPENTHYTHEANLTISAPTFGMR